LHSPSQYLLREWLTAVPGSPLSDPLQPPRGLWILCGYGRFGRAVAQALEREGNRIRVIEPDPIGRERPDALQGSGTEACTLEEAGIGDAVGIVAGTSDDVNNFSIAMTARELKPGLFIVMRKNRRHNKILFDVFGPQLIMQPAQVVARECLSLLTTPLLARFLAAAEREGNDWASELVNRIAGLDNRTPEIWSLAVTPAGAPAAWREFVAGALRVEHLLLDHADRDNRLDSVALLLERDGQGTLLPEDSMPLEGGDLMLFCGTVAARSRQLFAVSNRNAMHYATTGEIAHGAVWNWLLQKTQRTVP
jgi:voltage-gated potassium channel